MYAIYGNMDPINIPPMLVYIPAPWIRHGVCNNLPEGVMTSSGSSRFRQGHLGPEGLETGASRGCPVKAGDLGGGKMMKTDENGSSKLIEVNLYIYIYISIQ